jgi:transcription elongation GreA/GreB family factor
MPVDSEILICDCTAGFDDTRRFAVLDELTLTYDIVERTAGGEPRLVHRHLASLRQARAHACATSPHGGACPYGNTPVAARRPARGRDRANDGGPNRQRDSSDLEARIAELTAVVEALVTGGGARPGSIVRLADQAGHVSDYELADAPAPEIDRETVTATSPIGRELLGAKPGDCVSITLSNGRRKRVQVVDVMTRAGS